MDAVATIRTAVPEDARLLAPLCDALGYPSTAPQVHKRLSLLGDPERTLLVAEACAQLVGFVDVHVQRVVEEDAYAEIGGLVVASTHQGTGIGRELLAAAAAWSIRQGMTRLWIRANLARRGPHEFYERIGCRVVKDQRVYEYPL